MTYQEELQEQEKIRKQNLQRFEKYRNKHGSNRFGFLKLINDPMVNPGDINADWFELVKFDMKTLIELFGVCPEIKISPLNGNPSIYPIKEVLLRIICNSSLKDKNRLLDIAQTIQTDMFMKLFVNMVLSNPKRAQKETSAS